MTSLKNTLVKKNDVCKKLAIGAFCLVLPLNDGCVRERSLLYLNQSTSAGPCNIKITQFNSQDAIIDISAKGGNFKTTITVKYGEQILDIDQFHCPFKVLVPDTGPPYSLSYAILEK